MTCACGPLTIGTIFGQHTVEETRDLIRTTEFRVRMLEEQLGRIHVRRAGNAGAAQRLLDADWHAFHKSWIAARDTETVRLTAKILWAPAVPTSALPSEKSWNAIVDASTRNPILELRLGPLQERINQESSALGLPPVDLSGTPPPHAIDLDFEALKKMDAAIKAGEDAAARSATSTPAIVFALGAAAAVAALIVVKVYT